MDFLPDILVESQAATIIISNICN